MIPPHTILKTFSEASRETDDHKLFAVYFRDDAWWFGEDQALLRRRDRQHLNASAVRSRPEHVEIDQCGQRDEPLRRLFAFAKKLKWITSNPVEEARQVGARKLTGFYAWSEDDIAQYQRWHPLGSRARLALEILLWTEQRRGDARPFGPQHIVRGKIAFRASETQQDIKAVGGWKGDDEVTLYVASAEQEGLADVAISNVVAKFGSKPDP